MIVYLNYCIVFYRVLSLAIKVMRTDFSCCSLDGVREGAKTKVYPKHRYHKMACSMVYSKSLFMNVVKTFPIDS